MFGWLGVNEKFRNATNMILRVFQKWLEGHDAEIRQLIDRVDDLERVQKTLSDDMYDVQADLNQVHIDLNEVALDVENLNVDQTLIRNIEGYEDWRNDIGKPVKPVIEEEWINQGKERLGMKPVSKPTDIVK